MLRVNGGPKETPPVASTRAYLRNGLPSLYQDGDFGMRFVGALEELLDPIVAVLDALPAHFDPNHAPPDILELLSAWLGVDLDESQDIRHQREMVRRAAELGRRRGTVRGLELALSLHFPELPLRVEDNGGVIYAGRPAPEQTQSATFVVYCDTPVEETQQAAIARCIEQYKPVHSTYRLRVKAAKKKVGT
jgi:phage tail-like protein